MKNYPDLPVFHYIREHSPVAKVVIAAGLDMDIAAVERALAALLEAGMIGIAGYAPNDHPLYSPLDS